MNRYAVQTLGVWGWSTVLVTEDLVAAERDRINRRRWAFIRLPTRIIPLPEAVEKTSRDGTALVLRHPEPERVRDYLAEMGLTFVQEQHGRGVIHWAAQIGDCVLEIYPPLKSQPDASSVQFYPE